MTSLQELFAHAAEHAADLFCKLGELQPMWHTIDSADHHIVMLTPWFSHEEKHNVVAHLRQLFREQEVQRYVFMCEAWETVVPTLEQVKEWVGRIDKHPDRREIITIVAEDRNGKSLAGCYYILRPEHGPAKLSPLKMNEASESAGQLVGLLR
jgi:hypothetical protein